VTDRAALYRVEVRRRRGDPLPLADLDGAGTSLADVLARLLDGFAETSADGARLARVVSVSGTSDEVFALVQHGRRGVAADIVGPTGALRLRQHPDDLQLVRCGCLFRLPATATAGTLAVQLAYGRGVKGLFEQGLAARFGSGLPGLTLVLERLTDPDTLRRAVAEDRVERVQLVRIEPVGKRGAETGKWVPSGESARVELEVGVQGPGAGLGRSLLGRYLGGDSGAFADIVDFGGLTFDRARVGVRMPDDSRRLVDLEHPDAGRPATRTLVGVVFDRTGEPTEASLLAALRKAVAD
jgi:hypothetical protein